MLGQSGLAGAHEGTAASLLLRTSSRGVGGPALRLRTVFQAFLGRILHRHALSMQLVSSIWSKVGSAVANGGRFFPQRKQAWHEVRCFRVAILLLINSLPCRGRHWLKQNIFSDGLVRDAGRSG